MLVLLLVFRDYSVYHAFYLHEIWYFCMHKLFLFVWLFNAVEGVEGIMRWPTMLKQIGLRHTFFRHYLKIKIFVRKAVSKYFYKFYINLKLSKHYFCRRRPAKVDILEELLPVFFDSLMVLSRTSKNCFSSVKNRIHRNCRRFHSSSLIYIKHLCWVSTLPHQST